jgi:ATP-dependent exoDNAse (exonuclease V) beta subunit
VLDRHFVDATGARWIVDYKTSRHEGADADAFLDRERERYRAQLSRYAALVTGPSRQGLYFPGMPGWREF